MTGTLAGVIAFVAALTAIPIEARAADYHHVHLAAANAEEAVQWYIKHMGCTATPRKDACLSGTTQLLFANRAPKGGSQLAHTEGRSVDHLGFAFPDLDAAAAEIKKKGIQFQQEPRPFTNVLGQNMKLSFVVGPDGVRIEVVQPKA